MPEGDWQIDDLPSGVRCLTLRNSTKRNALNAQLLEQLASAIEPSRTSHVRVFLLRSEGPHAFSAGYDLTQLRRIRDGEALPDERLGEVLGRLATHPAPSVALVQGAAYGAGCELALACDFRIGTTHARFCMPPAKLGVIYSLEGMRRVSEKVGLQAARWLFLTAREVSGARAFQMGLLDEMHDSFEDANQSALQLTTELSALSSASLAGAKQGLRLIGSLTRDAHALEEFEKTRREAFSGEDFQEGVRAILEKRKPQF